MRGIENPWTFLFHNGFVRSTASNYYNGTAQTIRIEHIEKLCLLLNCSPSDLFEWHPDERARASAGENHALNSLIREKSAPNISDIVKDLPIEKMEEIGRMLKDLKEK